jgi:hypothetical protein
MRIDRRKFGLLRPARIDRIVGALRRRILLRMLGLAGRAT